MKNKASVTGMVYVGTAAALLAICSWICIPLTVPVTLQTLGVFLVSGLLGMKRGTAATVVFIIMGAIGIPVFAEFTGGVGILLGNTGGYIIGFIFTALIVGFASDKFKGKLMPVAIAMVLGVLVCYAFGTLWFAVVYAKSNEPAAILTILGWCVFPFILPDGIKIAVAAILTARLRKYIKQ